MTLPVPGSPSRLVAVVLATLITLLITSAAAQAVSEPPDWWPKEMEMPEGSKVEGIREIGSQVRMLTLRTDRDTRALVDRWANELETAGYTVDRSINPDGPPSFEFEGREVFNGQVVAMPCGEGCGARLQIDMTIN